MFRAFLQAVSACLVVREKNLIVFLCFRGCKRDMFRFSPYLFCSSTHISIHFMDPGGHLKGACRDICLLILVTFQTWQGVLLMGIEMSYFEAPLKFPQSHAPYRHPFNKLRFTALLPDHMTRPLGTAHESLKTQT